MKLNAVWHAKHPMPVRPTLDQRIAWHLEHARHCACRPIPPAIRACLRQLAEKRQAGSAAVSGAPSRA